MKLVVSGGVARRRVYIFFVFQDSRVGGERSRVQLINGNIKFRHATG